MAAGTVEARNLPQLRTILGRPITHAADLLELADRFDRSPLYVMRDAHLVLRLPGRLDAGAIARARRDGLFGQPHPFTDAWNAPTGEPGWVLRPQGLSAWIVGRRAGGPSRELAFVAYDADSGLREAACGAELLEAVARFERLVGIPYRLSPGHTSMILLRATHRGPGAVHLDRSADPPPPARESGVEADFRWIRELTTEERARRFVWAFDANGRYLASCPSLEVGFGEPDHLLPKPHLGTLTFDPRVPGYWLAKLASPGRHGFPDPFNPLGRHEPGPRWATTSTVELARELGCISGPILEAWVWPRHHRFLEPWYERLRDARAALLEDASPSARLALTLVKRTANMGIGFLAGGWRRPGDELYRPDWRHAIIARARANLYRRIVRSGVVPFAVDVDCLYVASDAASARAAGAGLPLGPELGRFKAAGCGPMGELELALERDLEPFRTLAEVTA